jgi:outer membrane protein assembly factor BamB/orotate phosphoribosyltransferase
MISENAKKMPKTALRKLIQQKSLIFSHENPQILGKNGKKCRWLFDLRSTLLDAEGADFCAQIFWEKFKNIWEQSPFQIAGLETAAIPLMTAIQSHIYQKTGQKINIIILKKERKNSGFCKNFEGDFCKNIPIILVDDIFNSGFSLQKALKIIQENNPEGNENFRPLQIFTLINFQSPQGTKFLDQNKLKLHAVFTLKDFPLELSPPPKMPPIFPAKIQKIYQPIFPEYYYTVPKSQIIQDDDCLYFGESSGKVIALEKKSHKIIWEFQTGTSRKGVFSTPAQDEKNIYVGSYDGRFYALEKNSGKISWALEHADWIGSSPAINLKTGKIFIGLEHALPNRKGSIICVKKNSGEIIWEFFTKNFIHASPALDEETHQVFIGTNDGEIFAFDQTTGRKNWEIKTGAPVRDYPKIAGKFAYVGNNAGKLLKIHKRSGEVVAAFQAGDYFYGSPLIQENQIFIGCTDKNFYILDLHLKAIKKMPTHGKIFSKPISWNNFIIFGNTAGVINFIDKNLSEISYQLSFTEKITNSLVKDLSSDNLYIKTCDDQIFEIKPN